MSYAEGACGCRSRVSLQAGRLLVCMKVAWLVYQIQAYRIELFPNYF